MSGSALGRHITGQYIHNRHLTKMMLHVHIPPLAAHICYLRWEASDKKDKGQLSILTVFALTMFALV